MEQNRFAVEKTAQKAVEIFTEVAPKYELLNSLLTAGRDKHWREKMLSVCESALGKKPDTVLDLATGTGDVARMMAMKWNHAHIIGTDPTAAMLQVAQDKSQLGKKSPNITWKIGVAEKLEFSDASLDLITIAFGFRNVTEGLRQKAVEEAYRVLKPGGVFAILELGMPKSKAWKSVYKLLLKHGMPTFAGLFAPKAPYQYLAQSVAQFPPPDNVRRMLSKAGFLAFVPRPLSTGISWLYIGKKPQLEN